jgi:hypothetical protein
MVTETAVDPDAPPNEPTLKSGHAIDAMDLDDASPDMDPREAEAIQALSEMRNSSEPDQRGFISRVSNIPVVNTTIRTLGNVYETSKMYSMLKVRDLLAPFRCLPFLRVFLTPRRSLKSTLWAPSNRPSKPSTIKRCPCCPKSIRR